MSESPEIGAERKILKPPEKAITLTRKAITLYQGILKSDSETVRLASLGVDSRQLLDVHLYYLSILRKLLGEIGKGQEFVQVVEQGGKLGGKPIEREDVPEESRRTFTARFAKEGENISSDPNNPQVQISLHTSIPLYDPESLKESYRAAGLRAKFEHDLERIFRESVEEIVYINTVGVYKNPHVGSLVIGHQPGLIMSPQGGISYRLRKGEDRARVLGFIYAGAIPHTRPLSASIPVSDFREIQSYVMEASGFKPQSSISVGK